MLSSLQTPNTAIPTLAYTSVSFATSTTTLATVLSTSFFFILKLLF
nr:MAG TPA: hypothetical protein [Caudoviricetes sp.]